MISRSDRPAAAVVAALAVLLLAAASWFHLVDTAADERLDRGMKTAFAAFATARALNAVISLVQSAQVSAQVGVGMSVHPGELLDPVNDLIERFSDVMLAAAVAFGVQKVLVSIGAHWVVPAVLSAAALAWLVLVAAGRARPRWLRQAIVVLLLVRFAVPAATLGSDLLFRTFLAPTQEASRLALERFRGQAEPLAQASPPGAADKGTVATVRDWIARGGELGTRVQEIADAAGKLSEHVGNLIVVFMLQTLLFPLALSWALWQFARSWLRAPLGTA